VIAISADEFVKSLGQVPQIIDMIKSIYPNVDILSAGGLLQLTLFGFVALLSAIAASTLVGAWASDERERRLELVAAAPLTRISWFLRSGGAVLLVLLVMGALLGLLTAAGAALAGDAALPVFSGALVLGLYASALAGVGLLVAGLGWPQFAAASIGGLAVGTYLLDLIGNVLRLPPDLLNLSLTRHLGQPMVGSYDWPGMAACLVFAIGGLAVGALTFSRRDLR
jgi:ABC-2 type transport system permease protein